ncbi:penicillin-binding protein activator [Hoeflea sp. WL0058]|uniref:Penicillin-binding protein activator n=1 Tax=Flavimaribacter sediminis TaxID=2865987 RepID=A0AAE2ZP85_9HYPH|nr:penicillin-binding protein activator [Flavimaribacter sediminis]MBW8638202.1 penicillin-binding protein activator [Flavimaribacter sediminis]
MGDWGLRDIPKRAFARLTALSIATIALALASCQQTVNYGLPTDIQVEPAFEVTSLPAKTGPALGEVLGSGPTRVAMLLPLSAPGNGARVAAEYRNAAELALETRGEHTMELVIKDTGGTPLGARARAEEAMREGAALVLGPVFSTSVASAASVTRPGKRYAIAFSSDPTAASPGVYLMSFLPSQVVDRVISYSVSIGSPSIAAILPEGAYGALVEQQLRASLKKRGGRLTGVSYYRYDNQSLVTAVEQVLPAIEEADAIFLPDGGQAPIALARVLQSEGVKLPEKRLIGTGQWRSSDLKSAYLQGGIFADMDETYFTPFRENYREKFGADPTVNGGLGFDSVMLAADLLASGNPEALSRSNLENSRGYLGVTGAYRFLPDGLSSRSLAIYQIQEGEAVVLQPAPAHPGAITTAQY